MANKDAKGTKICKYCKEEIDATAKVCPKCHKTQKIPVIIIIIICFFGLGLIGTVFGGGSEETADSSAKTEEKGSTSAESSENTTQPSKPSIEYIKVSKDELDADLENNAAAAKDKYATKYLEINGKLGTIDSDLSYFYLMSDTEEYDFNGVYCKLKNSQQKDQIKTLQKDQLITVKGQVTGVGEYMGYHINVTEIIAR